MKRRFRRIKIAEAKKRYKEGKWTIWCPVNLRPGEPWNCGIPINNLNGRSWNSVYNEFKSRNCFNSETGRYIAFYLEETEE